MLLTLTTTYRPATDLGYLLHKHPGRCQTFDLPFGKAHVFYPEAAEDRCTAALVLDVDPIGLVRRRRGPAGDGFSLRQYVNDRPYVASSLMSVAIARVFSSALGGRCKDRPRLVEERLPLEARMAVVPSRGEGLLHRLFEPLGYEVTADRHELDSVFADWGPSDYRTVSLRARTRLQDLLTHLYVLIPVLDNDKHYWVGEDELEKLLQRGEGWLADHPERALIARRYLKHQRVLAREALARLADEDHPDPDAEAVEHGREEAALEAMVPVAGVQQAQVVSASKPATVMTEPVEKDSENEPPLNTQRLTAVLEAIRAGEARSVIDLGCGEGRLLRLLLDDKQFDRIVGMDVSMRPLKMAAQRLRLDRLPEAKRRRIELMHGSLMYRDARLAGFDAAACVEVIEHLDPPRLAAFERVVFEFARPGLVVITTPNVEYNVRFETLPAGRLRHRDHRFEWTRGQFRDWAGSVVDRFGYTVRFASVGPEDSAVGPPTQMGVLVDARA